MQQIIDFELNLSKNTTSEVSGTYVEFEIIIIDFVIRDEQRVGNNFMK